MLSRRLSLRALLAIPFLVQALVLAAAIGWLSYQAGQLAVDRLARQLAENIFSRIEKTTNGHLRDSRLIAETVRVAAAAGQLDTDDFAALERYFFHLTQVTPAAPYIYFGNPRGDFIGVDRGFGEGVTTRIKNAGTAGTRYSYRIDAPGDRSRLIPEQSGKFDTLSRPWYRQAMQTGAAGWTPIYLSPVKRVLEMTQAMPIADLHGDIVGAVGVDVSLGYLSQFMRGLSVSPHGVAFLMEPSGELVASSDSSDPFTKTRLAERRMLAAASANPLIREAAMRLLDPGEARLAAGNSSTLSFPGKDGPVQVVAQQLGHGDGLHWIVAVAIPRADLTPDTQSIAYRTLAVCLLVLGVMLAFGLFILRRIRVAIGQLTRAAEKLGGGEWSQPLPTERKDEIGKLARAFATMSEKLRHSMATVSTQNEALTQGTLLLEGTVAARTAELHQQNERLRQEVAERARIELDIRKLSNIVEQTDDSIIVFDAERKIEYVNPGFERLTGYTLAEVAGRSPDFLHVSELEPAYYEAIWIQLAGGEAFGGVVVDRKKNGERYHAAVTITPIPNKDGKIVSYISVAKDVTERERVGEQMRQMLEVDRLTGLMSRPAFTERLQRQVASAGADAPPGRFALLFMDLDGFKRINDEYGHDTGDRVLEVVGRRLRHCLRDEDPVARLGGDEFVALLSDLHGAADAEKVANKIIDEINRPIMLSTNNHHVGITVGIAVFPDDGADAEGLLSRADQAMYAAKKRGKNTYARLANSRAIAS